jgi:VanZ family protein
MLWLAMIAMFSSGEFKADNTGGVLEWLLHKLHIAFTVPQFSLLHGLIRKSAHFSAYGLLSTLAFRAWRGNHQRWRWSWALLALLVALLTASADEFHQSFTPGRTGAVSDVILDMTGALFAQLMIVAGTAGRRKT